MQKQKAQLNVEAHRRCWICERLLSVYWENPYNHSKKLNWLLGVVYLRAEKPAKMITGRRTHFLCIELQFCGAIAWVRETLKIWAWKLFVATALSPCVCMSVLSLLNVLCLLSVMPLKSASLWALPLIILCVFNVCECVNLCLAMHCLSFLSFSFFSVFFLPTAASTPATTVGLSM